MLAALTIGSDSPACSIARSASPSNPVVPMTMAAPISRQRANQRNVAAGTEKSISTSGSEGSSAAIGRPSGPRPDSRYCVGLAD